MFLSTPVHQIGESSCKNRALAGFLVRIDDLPELKRDDEEREVSARMDIPAGEEFRFSFDLLASRTKVGKELASHIEVVYLWDQVRWNSEFSRRITNAPSTAGVVIGGFRFHPAAGWLLGWMVSCGLMFVWIHARLRRVRKHSKSHVAPADVRRMPAFGIVALVMGPLAFLMVLGGMACRLPWQHVLGSDAAVQRVPVIRLRARAPFH